MVSAGTDPVQDAVRRGYILACRDILEAEIA